MVGLALLIPMLIMGCVVTEHGDFPLERNYPASIRSQPGTDFPLGRIHVIELTNGAQPDIELDVIISDLNVDDDLEAMVFVNTREQADGFTPVFAMGGAVERWEVVEFDSSPLQVEGCHRVELQVSTAFVREPPFGVPIYPADADDLGSAVWWFFTRDDPTRTFDPAACPVRQPPERPDD
jgi:hypothetical protein